MLGCCGEGGERCGGRQPPTHTNTQLSHTADAERPAAQAGSTKPGDAGDAADPSTTPSTGSTIAPASYLQLAKHFAIFGWTAFGGPSAHVAQFMITFCDRTPRLLSKAVFAEMFALAQCIPGPSSTQLAYGLGIVKKGVLGGFMTGLLFQLPGLVMMSLVGVGVADFLKAPAPWLKGGIAGLGAAGIALVAQSAVALTAGVCKTDRVLLTLSAITATITFYVVKIWLFPALIAFGGIVTLIHYRRKDMRPSDADDAHVENYGLNRWAGLAVCGVWLAVLVGTLVATRLIPRGQVLPLDWWRTFYLSGSYIFGGGQVVIPMLYNDVVTRSCVAAPGNATALPTCTDAPDTWVTSSDFYTGLAVVQAMPGPLFNFAPYLGAVAAKRAGIQPIVGIIVGWLGLNAPGILLYYGLLPWWGAVRHSNIYRRVLPGLNSSAVGLVTAAALTLTITLRQTSPFPDASIAIGMVAYTAAAVLKLPTPLVVIGGGVLGVVAWATKMH